MKIQLLWQNYRYFPYEREFAKREVQSLMGQKPSEEKTGLAVNTRRGWERSAKRTTYFREIFSDEGHKIIPLQTQIEALANGSISSDTLVSGILPPRTRQSTRYSAHGLHEYRGKFNPQVVRAISNIMRLKPGDWILDPFCGSGTALLEAFHIGLNAVGIDLNPLGVEIANAKINSMHVPIDQLLEQTATLKVHLNERIAGMRFDRPFSSNQIKRLGGSNWQSRLNCPDYLRLWFTESVLVQLAAIIDEIGNLPSNKIRSFMRVILSDIVRDVSLQDSADLRIRRRKSPPENSPAIPLFLDSLSKKLSSILKTRQLVQAMSTTQVAIHGNVLRCQELFSSKMGHNFPQRFDASITSPPYATALPYIDTQRLSLVLLGLIDARRIRDTERSLIGNREITSVERLQLEAALTENLSGLPRECVFFCQMLQNAVDLHLDGFRRENVPALLYKYLSEMAQMFRQVHSFLKKSAQYALIVGRNSTRLGGQHFTVDTARLLVALAKANGFKHNESIELEAYHRFDVHQANSIRSETLILLEKE